MNLLGCGRISLARTTCCPGGRRPQEARLIRNHTRSCLRPVRRSVPGQQVVRASESCSSPPKIRNADPSLRMTGACVMIRRDHFSRLQYFLISYKGLPSTQDVFHMSGWMWDQLQELLRFKQPSRRDRKMAKPSQLQQPGVERVTRDTPGKEKQKSDPGGIAALRLRRRRLVWASRLLRSLRDRPSRQGDRETGGVALKHVRVR